MTAKPPSQLVDRLARTSCSVVHDLGTSFSDALDTRTLLDFADADQLAWLERQELGYAHPHGSELLRSRVASLYGKLDGSQVICCAGAHDAASCVAAALLSPGDHAAIVLPIYEPLEWIVTDLVEATGIPLDLPGLRLDVAKVAAAITPRTKLVLMNFPNSPTGIGIGEQTLMDLVQLCRERGLWLVNDEVYRHLTIDRSPPSVADVYERGISIDAVSKGFGLPGLRVGWAACQDKEFLAAASLAKAGRSSYLAVPSDVLACIALSNARALTHRSRAVALANRTQLHRMLASHPEVFSSDLGDNLLFACPRYLHPEGPAVFADRLLAREHTLVLPTTLWASRLGVTPGDRVRIGTGRRACTDGLATLSAHLRRCGT